MPHSHRNRRGKSLLADFVSETGFYLVKCHTRPFIFTIGYQHSRVARPDTILFLFLCSSSGIFPILRFKHWQVMDSFVLLVCLKTGHLMSEMSDFTQKKEGETVWALAYCEWRAAAPGLNSLHLPCANILSNPACLKAGMFFGVAASPAHVSSYVV